MKPIETYQDRAQIYIGDILFVKDQRNLYFVDEIRNNRRRYDEDDISSTVTEKTEITLTELKGVDPTRLVRINAIGYMDRSGEGMIVDMKRGETNCFSKQNIENLVLDTNTAGEVDGAVATQAIVSLLWGAIPVDLWSFSENDEYTIYVLGKSGTPDVSVIVDVTEYSCKKKTLDEFGSIGGLPAELVLVSYFGARRISLDQFDKMQVWL